MHILLAEDSNDDASLIIDFLKEERQAHIVERVPDGREALDYLHRQGKYAEKPEPDLILLDLAMPRMDGYELLRHIKSEDATRDIPVIVLTTSYNPIDDINCKNLGASAFYSKPSSLQGYEDLVQTFMNVEFPRLAGNPASPA